jgi:membrane protease YdiL (CAAX protease family)
VNGVEEIVENTPVWIIFIVMVVIAPIVEEIIFRKVMIDRLSIYGDPAAIIFSSVAFGLMHGNLYQFFYAFALGLVFAYIYLRTGRLRYTAILHAVINFMGSVVAPWVLEIANVDVLASLDPTMPTEELLALYMDILPGMLAVLAYSLVLIGFFIAGLVLFIIKVRRLVWKTGSEQLPEKTAFRTIYCNGGMIAFMAFCLVMIVFNLT